MSIIDIRYNVTAYHVSSRPNCITDRIVLASEPVVIKSFASECHIDSSIVQITFTIVCFLGVYIVVFHRSKSNCMSNVICVYSHLSLILRYWLSRLRFSVVGLYRSGLQSHITAVVVQNRALGLLVSGCNSLVLIRYCCIHMS